MYQNWICLLNRQRCRLRSDNPHGSASPDATFSATTGSASSTALTWEPEPRQRDIVTAERACSIRPCLPCVTCCTPTDLLKPVFHISQRRIRTIRHRYSWPAMLGDDSTISPKAVTIPTPTPTPTLGPLTPVLPPPVESEKKRLRK